MEQTLKAEGGQVTGILDLMRAKWAAEDWDPNTLNAFRMEDEGDGGDDDPDADDPEDGDDDEDADDDTKGKAKKDDEPFDEARAKKTIDAQRASEKKLKKDLQDARKELKDIKDKDLPEKERQTQAAKDAEERATAAEGKLQKAVVRTAALEAASKLGFKDPALAYRLLDHDDVEWDDDEPSNITLLLKDILKESPYLKGGRRKSDDDDEDDGADGGAGRGKSGKGFSMNDELRSMAGR